MKNRVGMAVLAALAAHFVFGAITAADYPDANLVTVEEVERVSYATNGTWRSEREWWTKILTERGRRNLRSLSFDYNARYGKAELVYVGAIGVDGREREIDFSATLKDTTDNSSADSNIYDPLDRCVSCSVPGLAVGETLHVKMARTAFKSRVEGAWSDVAVFERTRPVLKSVYEVRAPKDLPIRSKAVRNPLGNLSESVRTLDDGSVIHTFVATNSPQMFREPDMPTPWTVAEHVRLSTVADWKDLSRWYWELCAPHLAKTNAAMAAKVAELTAGKATRAEALRAIFDFVSIKVRYLGLTREDDAPGYAPHDVDVTFDDLAGVCRDKAALLVAMLRLAGFEAYPALVSSGAGLDADVPQLNFNHAIVAVDGGEGDYTLMDPTVENTKDYLPAYLCERGYLVARPQAEAPRVAPAAPPAGNSVRIATKATLDRDGVMVVESDIRFFGLGDTVFRGTLLATTREARIGFFTDVIRAFSPGAELVRCEIEPKDPEDTETPFRARLVSRIPGQVIEGETVAELNLPFLSAAKIFNLPALILKGDTGLAVRKYPLVVSATGEVDESFELDLGGNLGEAVYLPPDADIGGALAYRRTVSVSNGTLRAVRTASLGQTEISPTEYTNLLACLRRIEPLDRRRPRFARDPYAGVDSYRRLVRDEVTTLSDYSWVGTSVVETVVCTPRGKDQASDCSFAYNPSVSACEVVSATVSNRDGRVYAVAPDAISVMDCDWASRAPRYPAGKTIVVHFPSVEIGSVIRSEIVTTVTNSPLPFQFERYFDDYGRVDRIVARVDGWRRDECRVRRLPTDASQIDGRLWRDFKIVSRGSWTDVAARFRKATEVEPFDPRRIDLECDLEAIRNWMVRHVRIVGPMLHEVPLERQVTDPETVLRERYATRLDYMRTFCALLKGAGLDADIVFAASDQNASEEVRRLDRETYPNYLSFAYALCRVRVREGGFLGFGGRRKTFFIGTENERTPLGATSWEGCGFFDPADASFGTVTLPDDALASAGSETFKLLVHEDASVDVSYDGREWGWHVGVGRRAFSELLPEKRERFKQAVLSDMSHAATFTSEPKFDVEGYPFSVNMEYRIPDLAEITGDTITVPLESLGVCAIPDLPERVRRVGIEVGSRSRKVREFVVRFPKGYVETEYLPEDLTLCNPYDVSEVWETVRVSKRIDETDGTLEVRVAHEVLPRKPCAALPAVCGKMFDEWQRRVHSRQSTVIMVRKSATEM